MKKRFLLITAFIFGIILMVHPYVYTSSSGAPTNHAGVPGENNCRACHSDKSLNVNGGSLVVKLFDQEGNESQNYKPGNKYKIRVNISKTNSVTWGFETTVRKSASTATNIGVLEAHGTDIQLISNGSKKFVTHSSQGTNLQQWEFDWTAPQAGTGEVTIYTAANAANGNGQSSGDFIYTNQLKIAENINVSVKELPVVTALKIFPNPVSEVINISFQNETTGLVEANLLDISGRHINKLFYGIRSAGEQQISANIEGIAPGNYLLQLTVDGRSSFHKLIIK